MLTPHEFAYRWQREVVAKSAVPDSDRLVTAPRDLIVGVSISDEARRFLTEAGLPYSCAPCLAFDEVAQGLQRLWEVFAPGQWKPNEKHGLEHYGLIGFDGSGNPICLDERTGHVVLIDHELLFDPDAREDTIMFVNSSLRQLCECLLAVNALPSAEQLAAIKQIDEPAAAKRTFWHYEAISRPDDDTGVERVPSKPWWKFW
jgi:SUKH-4 immunity protein of toxin-antitoxin system